MEKRFRGWLQGIVALLMVAPFLQGLFPTNYQLPAEILAAVSLAVFTLSFGKRRKERFQLTDYAAIALAGLYLVATAWAVNHRDAFQEAMKQVLYMAAYWITSRSVRTERDRHWLLTWLCIAATALAVGSALLVTGAIPYKDALLYNRIAGPYQYPNVLAAHLFVGIGLAASLRSIAGDATRRALWSMALYTNVAVFVFTYSRIAWLMAPAVALLFFVLLPPERRWTMVRVGIALVVGLAAVFAPVDAGLRTGPVTLVPVWLALGAVLTSGVDWCLEKVRGNRRAAVGLAGAGVIVLGLAVALVAVRSESLLARLSSYSTSDNSVLMRFWTYKDATRAWLQHAPVLGLGGAGWRSIYLSYRSVAIVSKVTHSSLVETLTELGLQGVLLLLLLWGGAFALGLKGWKKAESTESKVMWAGAIAGLTGQLLHSWLDFDLWYPAATILVYVLLGVFRSSGETSTPLQKGEAPNLVSSRIIAGALALLAVVMFPLEAAGVSYLGALKQLQQSQLAASGSSLARAVRLDPFNSSLHSTYGDFLTQVGAQTNNTQDVAQGAAALEKAVKLSPYNPDYQLLLAKNAQVAKNGPAVAGAVEKAVVLDPNGAETYTAALNLAFSSITTSIDTNGAKDLEALMGAVGEILTQYDRQVQRQPKGVQADWLLTTGDTKIQVSRARYEALQGKVTEALSMTTKLVNSVDESLRQDALFWSAVFAIVARQDANGFLQGLQQMNSPLVANVQPEVGRLTRFLSSRS